VNSINQSIDRSMCSKTLLLWNRSKGPLYPNSGMNSLPDIGS